MSYLSNLISSPSINTHVKTRDNETIKDDSSINRDKAVALLKEKLGPKCRCGDKVDPQKCESSWKQEQIATIGAIRDVQEAVNHKGEYTRSNPDCYGKITDWQAVKHYEKLTQVNGSTLKGSYYNQCLQKVSSHQNEVFKNLKFNLSNPWEANYTNTNLELLKVVKGNLTHVSAPSGPITFNLNNDSYAQFDSKNFNRFVSGFFGRECWNFVWEKIPSSDFSNTSTWDKWNILIESALTSFDRNAFAEDFLIGLLRDSESLSRSILAYKVLKVALKEDNIPEVLKHPLVAKQIVKFSEKFHNSNPLNLTYADLDSLRTKVINFYKTAVESGLEGFNRSESTISECLPSISTQSGNNNSTSNLIPRNNLNNLNVVHSASAINSQKN